MIWKSIDKRKLSCNPFSFMKFWFYAILVKGFLNLTRFAPSDSSLLTYAQ